MKSNLILIFLFLVANLFSQTSTYLNGVKLSIRQKIKEGSKPLASMEVEVFINDSSIFKGNTDDEGYIGKFATQTGKLNIKIKCKTCDTQEMQGIIVSEGKTAYVNFLLTCESYINSLTKKEKKKLGYK